MSKLSYETMGSFSRARFIFIFLIQHRIENHEQRSSQHMKSLEHTYCSRYANIPEFKNLICQFAKEQKTNNTDHNMNMLMMKLMT